MPEQPRFDAVKHKEAMRKRWQDAAEAWHRWIPVVREWAGPATELMLELTGVGPGGRVLDIAAGDGDQSLLAAARVGPTGLVLATDIAPNLVALAAQTVRESEIKNLEARVMDAENLAELDGMAEGMNAAGHPTSRDELIAYNGYVELSSYWWPEELKKLKEGPPPPVRNV